MKLLLFSCAHSAHGCSHCFPCCFDLNFHSAVVSSIRLITMLRVLKRALSISISLFSVHTSLNCNMYVGAWLFICSSLCTAEAMPSSRTHTIQYSIRLFDLLWPEVSADIFSTSPMGGSQAHKGSRRLTC